MARALENLLSNAARYSRRGDAVELDVTATDDTVTFVVADRGPGVPGSAAKRLFEKFGIDKRTAGAKVLVAALRDGRLYDAQRDGRPLVRANKEVPSR